MSHFTRVRTRFTDGTVLRDALAEMGHKVRPAGTGVRGYLGQRTNAEFKIRPGRGKHEIGFVNSDGGYEVVADWWGIDETTEERFVRALKQKYALVSTVSTLRDRGFEIDRRSTEESGEIRVVLRRAGV
ncbi:DUF1257 domain-containing protein [Actinomadura algeriensis]|uniref:DUF1257 domain-containing protein n=1 Tax=Actinomadura algeriensis TaxID=1679523 RepID=A0ABR9JJB6_9ACTN|nr:DUF1257 domain-containing protein [Actinomadura algeriensis]MBE1530549.1 hypothetical protein [Actinomadura algeriensis]